MYNIVSEQVLAAKTALLTLWEFARKLIRPVGGNQQEIQMGIDNEIRVITKLCSNDGHRNIISILQHGWLNKDQWYYFDMELCAMNLEEFIYGRYITTLGSEYFDPIAVEKGLECLKLWNIMRDITRGLEYIHSLREVHRDLKPQNGMSNNHLQTNDLVLLSVNAGAWKITDFGLTFEGTSRIQYTTRNSRGTEGYRAVEVLGIEELGFVTKASDIWALGCILHELAFRKKLFPRDFNVWDYARTQKLKEQPRVDVDERTAACIRELILRTLDVDWWKRPTASDIVHLLDTLTNPGIVGTAFYVGDFEAESGSQTSDPSSSNPSEPITSSRSRVSSPPVLRHNETTSLPFISHIERMFTSEQIWQDEVGKSPVVTILMCSV